MKDIALYLTTEDGVHHELLAGRVPEKTLPSFVIAISRLRETMAVELYVSNRLVIDWRVNGEGCFQLNLRKQVRNG